MMHNAQAHQIKMLMPRAGELAGKMLDDMGNLLRGLDHPAKLAILTRVLGEMLGVVLKAGTETAKRDYGLHDEDVVCIVDDIVNMVRAISAGKPWTAKPTEWPQ